MKKRVWITGASSGIGKAVALEFATRGYDLVISGRNIKELDALSKTTQAFVLPFDITNREANLQASQLLLEKFGSIDTVFLNAGTCEYVDVKQFDSLLFERVLKTNFLGMVYGIEAALPLLRKSRFPQLVGMSSTVSYIGLPRAEAYGASKAAINNMLQSLRCDLRKENIAVSIVCPGFVKTPLTDRNDFTMPSIISAEKAANIIVNGIEEKKYEIYFPLFFSLALKFIAILPNRLSTYLIAKYIS
jgi:short-subunit dehydrogenase